VLLLVVCGVHCIHAESVEKELNVRPNVDDSVELKLKDITCKFEYKCTGGTNEKWKMTLSDDDGAATCFVGRPSPPSYLFFSTFSASLGGKTLSNVEVWDNSGVVLQNDQYIVEGNKEVKVSSGWGGNLALLVMSA